MATAENPEKTFYNWTCPSCEVENTSSDRVDVVCENCGAEYDEAPIRKAPILESPVRINIDGPFTPADVARLIGSVEDDRAWTLVVSYKGEAYLLDFHENRERLGLGKGSGEIDLSDSQRFMEDLQKDIEQDELLLAQKSDKVYLRWETYGLGTGYVGPEAGADDLHVGDIYRDLKKQWETKPKAYHFIGE